MAIAPDGRSLYVAGHDANAVASFSIDPVGGALLQLGGKGACVRGGDDAGACLDGRALLGADALAISPDGSTLYAAAKDIDAVAVMQRDPTTGALSQQPGQTGCIRLNGGLGCATARALAQPSALAITPDGRDLYVASSSGNAVALLQRDAATGLLIQPAGAAGCIGQGIADCSRGAAPDGTDGARAGPGRDQPHGRDRRRRHDPHAAPRHDQRPARRGSRACRLHLDDRRGRLPGARAARADDVAGDRARPATCSMPPPAPG